MLEYLYKGDYEADREDDDEIPVLKLGEVLIAPEPENDISSEQKTSSSSPTKTNDLVPTDLILRNIEVNAIADYYDLPKLVELSNSKVKLILAKGWITERSVEAVRYGFTRCNDASLHNLLISYVTPGLALQ